jgi:hypothetical protein
MHLHAMTTVTHETASKRHEEIKKRAAEAGLSVQQLLLREAERSVSHVSRAELFRRLKSRSRIDIGMSGADLVHAAREEYDQELIGDRY